jgi:hypothetical protein
MNDFKIEVQMEEVGSVTFDQPEKALAGTRTASGIRVYLPASVTLSALRLDPSPLLFENLKATLSASGIEIGVARYSDAIRTPRSKLPIQLVWDLTLQAFAVYESIRAGGEPQFDVLLRGDIRYILPGQGWKEACSIASPFTQPGFIKYSRDAWTKMLRELKVQDTVLVEIPFPSDPPNGWEPVWHALRDARDSFDTGGSTGWKNCVTAVRLALEEWRKIEQEDKGLADTQARTKIQRIDNLRWHLIQLAHYAAHTKADEWTRDDALLALSTLSALLAVRKP